MDDIARALAIFTDLKCPTFLGHSTGVAALAERAAGQMDLGTDETRALRWAALLHDVGRLGVPEQRLDATGPARLGAVGAGAPARALHRARARADRRRWTR